MSARYEVAVYDCAGEFRRVECGSNWARCLEVAADMTAKYPRKFVQVVNQDAVDLDFDGLTDDEREAVDAASDVAGAATDAFRMTK